MRRVRVAGTEERMPEDTVQPGTDALSKAVSHMNGVLVSESTLNGVLELVVFLAHGSFPDVRGVSVSLIREGQLITAAYTSKHAQEADDAQYELGVGPCIESIRCGRVVHSDDLLAERRWADFTPRALEEGAYAILSAPLQVHGRTVGALNIYSAKARSFDDVQEDVRAFAQHAATVLANAQAYAVSEQLNGQLEDALESRGLIGEAKGILMERERVSSPEAFEMLRRISQENNVKLRDIAQRLVDSVSQADKTET
jgi:GAF domain-containing protein